MQKSISIMLVLVLVFSMLTACDTPPPASQSPAPRVEVPPEATPDAPTPSGEALDLPFTLIPLEGAENVRDLGGYIGTDGKAVNFNVFIRSAKLNTLTDADQKILFEEVGVDCIIDLRSASEAGHYPDIHPEGVDYYSISVPTYGEGVIINSLADMYMAALDMGQAEILAIMEIMANPEYETILFHCNAGKDRTGVIAMLLLGLAGVDNDTISEDYKWSEQFNEKTTAETLAERPDLKEFFVKTPKYEMQSTLEYLDRYHGGAVAYLTAIGLGLEQQQLIIDKMLG